MILVNKLFLPEAIQIRGIAGMFGVASYHFGHVGPTDSGDIRQQAADVVAGHCHLAAARFEMGVDVPVIGEIDILRASVFRIDKDGIQGAVRL